MLPFTLVRKDPAEFWIFLLVNLFFGGAGLWFPAVGSYFSDVGMVSQVGKALDSGTGYMLSITLLASSLSFIVREYLGNEPSDFRDVKTIVGVLAFMLLMTMFALAIFTVSVQQLGLYPETSAKPIWATRHTFQAGLALLGFLFAAFLFCVERIDEYPEEFSRWKSQARAGTNADISAASSKTLKT